MQYIVFSKADMAATTLALGSAKAGAAHRKEQIERLRKTRRQTFETRSDASAPEEAAEAGLEVVLAAEKEAPLTGATIISSEEGVDAVRARMPNSLVFQDYPITLIEPVGESKAYKTLDDAQSGEDRDRSWHQRAIGLSRARADGFNGKGKGEVIAVTDTGIAEVDELRGRIAAAYELNESGEKFVKVQTSRDTKTHGTHVAGIISGRTIGIAPAAKVENVLMIPNGRGSAANFVKAMEHIAQRPNISIMNMSAGRQDPLGDDQDPMVLVLDVLRAVGILPVVAIGNEGPNRVRVPGAYVEALSVGACDPQNRVANFSGGGELSRGGMHYQKPNCLGPGDGVISCVPDGKFKSKRGTSMATPVVSGLAALILEAHSGTPMSVLDLEQEILRTCRDIGADRVRQGKGLVQIPDWLSPNAVA